MGEGDCEYAFLKYLKSIYCSDRVGVNVTIRNAQGGGPDSIIYQVIRHIRLASYDQQVALLDTDLAWSGKLIKNAKKNKIEMIGSTPCLEGLLLRVLSKPVPDTSDVCKKILREHTKADMTQWRHYVPYFSKEIFEEARKILAQLDKLLNYFEGK
jgi:hypothetical protein